MKLPSFVRNSIYEKMPLFFNGGDTGFKPVSQFKSIFDQPKIPETNVDDPSIPYNNIKLDESQRRPVSPINYIGQPSEFKQNGNFQSMFDKDKKFEESPKSDTMGALRDGMYIGNALLRGFSESNANRQMEQYEQMNTANPLANMAYNDGRSNNVMYGYEQFMKGGGFRDKMKKFYKK